MKFLYLHFNLLCIVLDDPAFNCIFCLDDDFLLDETESQVGNNNDGMTPFFRRLWARGQVITTPVLGSYALASVSKSLFLKCTSQT